MKKYIIALLITILLFVQPLALNAKQKDGKKTNVNKKLELNVGDVYKLKEADNLNKKYNNKLIFSSSDSLTVSVDSKGKILAQGGGEATVSIRLKENKKLLTKYSFKVKRPSPITISFITDKIRQPSKDNTVFKDIKEKLGVNFKINYYVGNDEEKIGVMIASGNYTDIINSTQKLIDAKAEIPLEGLIDKYAPNIKKHLSPYYNQLKDPRDGHLYYMVASGRMYGKASLTNFFGTGFFIQKAVLKEFGYPKITTLDEYFNIIKKYKAKHPTIGGMPTIGYVIENYDWHNFGLLNPPQFLAGYPNDGNVIVNQKTYRAQIFANKDIMKRFIKKLNDINREGLLDQESFILNHDQYIARLSEGNVLGFCDQKWNMNTANYSLLARGKIERQYVSIPIVFDKGIKQRYLDAPELNISNGIAITVNCKNPVRVIKFFNAIMTEEWQKRLQWGAKGKDYLVDDKGEFYRNTAMRKAQGNATNYFMKNRAEAIFQFSPKMEGRYSDGNPCSAGESLREFWGGLNSYDKKFLSSYNYRCWTDFFGKVPDKNPVYYPCWNIPLTSKSSAAIAISRIKDYQMQTLPKLIMSNPASFERLWRDYVNDFSANDVRAYEKAMNDGIQWRIKHWTP